MGHVPRFPEFQECEDPEKELSNAVVLSYSSVLDTLMRRARLPMTRAVETRYPPFVLRFFQFGEGKHVVFASLYGGGGLMNKRYHTFGPYDAPVHSASIERFVLGTMKTRAPLPESETDEDKTWDAFRDTVRASNKHQLREMATNQQVSFKSKDTKDDLQRAILEAAASKGLC